MMDQEERVTDNSQPKFITRSTARHLRRKRLNDARRAKNQLLGLSNGVDNSSQEAGAEATAEEKKPEVLTKSKARRLRKKNKAKLLENCTQPTCCYGSCMCTSILEASLQKYTKQNSEYDPLYCGKEALSSLQLGNIPDFQSIHPFLSLETDIDRAVAQTENFLNRSNSGNGKKRKEKTYEGQAYGRYDKKDEYLESNLIPEENSLDLWSLNSINVSQFGNTPQVECDIKDDLQAQLNIIENSLLNVSDVSSDIKSNYSQPESSRILSSSNWELLENKTAFTIDDLSASLEDSIQAEFGIDIRDLTPKTEPDATATIKNTESTVTDCTTQNPDITGSQTPVTSETNISSSNLSPSKMTDEKSSSTEKTREQIKAEREAKKAAKAAAKAKAKEPKAQSTEVPEKTSTVPSDTKAPEKAKKPKSTNETVSERIVPSANEATIAAPNDVPKNDEAVKNEGKSKAELRAERRAKQEAQRAAKQQLLSEKTKAKPKEPVEAPSVPSEDATKKPVKKVPAKENAHEVNLFKHLYHERELALINVPTVNSSIHPAIVRLGVQYANKVIVGSNARCVALLAAVKQLIQDFERPSQADFIRGLEASLQESAAYLHHCRPLAVSMQNALRHLKWQMTRLPATLSDKDARSNLESAIDTYIQEQIHLAGEAISITIQTKISDGNVILTYGYSSLIHRILLDAHNAGKKFRVIVVDGRPWLEGKEQLRRLAKHGIECSYILINALSFIMPEVSKVFLGAHAILANGAVMSRVGTAQVALMAKAFNIPVLVACETHKSCERVQTDSIVYNEIGDADDLTQNHWSNSKKSLLANWRTKKYLNLLNITYDVTPADLVTAVVTELAILPCTSVPVILRIKPSEI